MTYEHAIQRFYEPIEKGYCLNHINRYMRFASDCKGAGCIQRFDLTLCQGLMGCSSHCWIERDYNHSAIDLTGCLREVATDKVIYVIDRDWYYDLKNISVVKRYGLREVVHNCVDFGLTFWEVCGLAIEE